MIQALPDHAVQLPEMESSLQELKKLVSQGWTYAVIWKIGLDNRTPVWHQSCLNENLAGPVVSSAHRFESIYRHCQFTPARPGYAYLAWQRQSPFWWTRLMEPILTDKNKELFLEQAGIQTIVCFPGRAIPDGTGYCVELACTALVSETEFLRTSIQEFLNTSVSPYISTPLSQEAPATLHMEGGGFSSTTSAMAALAHQTSAILTDITIQASMGEDEAIEGFGNILRREEPYASWTMSSTQSHYFSAGLPSFYGGVENYPSFHDLSFNYGTSHLLSEPYEGVSIATQPASTEWTSSKKGKEILVEESDLVLPPGKQIPPSQNLNLLQQELLEKLRSPPSAPPGTGSPKTLSSGISPGYHSMRAVGGMPPGHIPTSWFRPHNRHLPFPPPTGIIQKRRQPLIYRWATSLVPRIKRIRDQIPGGSSFDGSSQGTDVVDPRSPNSVAHDLQAAVAHKIAERNRRMKFSHKLQTLISIVPMTNKKKDKVSVLSSTIDYIRQLNSRISTLKKGEEEAVTPSTSRMEAERAATTADREEELTMFNEAGPSSSSPMGATGGAPVVVVEGSPGEDKWVIKVEANNRTRSLIQLLNVLLELELGVITVDYGSTNERFHANICVKDSRSSSRSSSELQAMLSRVLETTDSPLTGSD